ncbi:MAG TPA: cellulase family glycosylhydrolase [Pyrinomonadaceae bacterium]|nr:cellulase family glycosylhydrolase [Pyrinomonadaceae bacterium]
MIKKILLMAVLVIMMGTAFFFVSPRLNSAGTMPPRDYVRTHGSRFLIAGKPFRFVGANVAVMYRDEDREKMPETLRQAAEAGMRVVRVWAYGEGGPKDIGPVGEDSADWPRHHPFRWTPDEWNEEALVHLDRVVAEAARNDLRVQLCLVNWWRDTGGITQYLRWAGIEDAADETMPYGINPHRAMLFYSNPETRRLFRQHIEKLVMRRNTVTGYLYRDDPAIFGWELMNEAQAVTGRWSERRAWIAEMSAYLRSLDPNHLITPGTWGYRSAAERLEWLEDHKLPNIDFIDVHNYPKDDLDSFVNSPTALRAFVENRVAAAYSLKKPLVFGEFGINKDGYKGFSQSEWYRAFFEVNLHAGAAGAMFWILTPDISRGYGVTYTSGRDDDILAETKRAAELFRAHEAANPPEHVTIADRHLVPRQFAFVRPEGDPVTLPKAFLREDKTILYQFKPRMARQARFEKLGDDAGYIWGSGVGFIEYVVPPREDRRRISELIVRAHLKPVPPIDAKPREISSRVTLYVNGVNCGWRLVMMPSGGKPQIQEWRINRFFVRLQAMRGLPLEIRFAVEPKAKRINGVNISNWPEGHDFHDRTPIEVELRR